MRLIDVDAVESAFTVLIYEFVHRAPNWSLNDMLTSGRDAALKYEYKADGVEAALNIARRMPTIDAEPVKHGAWIEKKPSRMKWIPDESDDITEEETTIEDMIEQKCSICQRWSIKFAHHIEMNFCPNCGARMTTRECNEP